MTVGKICQHRNICRYELRSSGTYRVVWYTPFELSNQCSAIHPFSFAFMYTQHTNQITEYPKNCVCTLFERISHWCNTNNSFSVSIIFAVDCIVICLHTLFAVVFPLFYCCWVFLVGQVLFNMFQFSFQPSYSSPTPPRSLSLPVYFTVMFGRCE